MSLSSLFLCEDQNIQRAFRRVLADLEINVDLCQNADQAKQLLSQRRFDAMLVECNPNQDAAAFLKGLKSFAYNRRAILLAIVKDASQVGSIRDTGVHFVIENPISFTRLTAIMRAAKNLMNRERRRAFRKSVDSLVSFVREDHEHFDALILDISHTGLAIKTPESLFLRGQQVRLRFCLPATDILMNIQGHVVWADDHGRTGISFTKMAPEAESQLKQWLLERRRTQRRKVSQLTVRILQDRRSIVATVLDVSDGGMAIRCADPLQSGSRVELEIVPSQGNQPLHASGRVVWAHHTGVAGITFIDLTAELEQTVRNWTESSLAPAY